jgi:hypothetical protein
MAPVTNPDRLCVSRIEVIAIGSTVGAPWSETMLGDIHRAGACTYTTKRATRIRASPPITLDIEQITVRNGAHRHGRGLTAAKGEGFEPYGEAAQRFSKTVTSTFCAVSRYRVWSG